MLYVAVEVNGYPVKAFVDSGAQATIMSPSCAEACNITKSIDTRFAGIARGVGTARILGRVHSAKLTIGEFKDYELPCAFTVMEGKDVDMLLGLDMLKRYQACIDLQRNLLVLGGGAISVPFLDEANIPRGAFEGGDGGEEGTVGSRGDGIPPEPTVPGPGGAAIGARTGALIPPPQGQAQAQAQASSSAASPARNLPRPSTNPPTTSNPSAPFPEADISVLMGLGASRHEAIEALRACDGNVEYAAGLVFGG